jgi:hypothetical protein
LSPEEKDEYLTLEKEVKHRIEDLDKFIEDVGSRIASFKLVLESGRENLVTFPAIIGNSLSLNDYPKFVRNKNDIDNFLWKFNTFMNYHKFSKSEWGKQLLFCFDEDHDGQRIVQKY